MAIRVNHQRSHARERVRGAYRRAVLVLALLVGSAIAANACIFTYTLVGPNGSSPLVPDSPVSITAGVYRIDVTMREDHGNCSLEAEDTLFLLEEARWRVNRETQPLVLLSDVVWEQIGATRYTTTIEFDARAAGEWQIDVIRECTRGGRHETLVINVV